MLDFFDFLLINKVNKSNDYIIKNLISAYKQN